MMINNWNFFFKVVVYIENVLLLSGFKINRYKYSLIPAPDRNSLRLI